MKREDEDATREVVARDAEGGEVACSALGRRDEKAKLGGLTKVECHGRNTATKLVTGRRARVSERRPLVVGGGGVFCFSLKKSLTPGLSELEPTRGPGRRYQHAAE